MMTSRVQRLTGFPVPARATPTCSPSSITTVTSKPLHLYHYHGMGGYSYTHSSTPLGELVFDQNLAAVIVIAEDVHPERRQPATRKQLHAAGALNTARRPPCSGYAVDGMPKHPNALVWAQPHFRSLCAEAAGIPDDAEPLASRALRLRVSQPRRTLRAPPPHAEPTPSPPTSTSVQHEPTASNAPS